MPPPLSPSPPTVEYRIQIGIASARAGVSVNAALAITNIVAGIIGHSFALVADGIESTIDIVSSLIVWAGFHVSGREADDQLHFGYGKAEALAAAVLSLTLIGAAVGIAVGAIRQILTPHELPAAFTLWILGTVIVIKLLLLRFWFHDRALVGLAGQRQSCSSNLVRRSP